MQTDLRPTMFVGPTLAALPASARALCKKGGFRLCRPVRRHDVAELVRAQRKPGLIVIVDGVFHDTLAVGHAEIREALDRGWRVWGLSSMGAIRAREMSHLGMRGYGTVYEQFAEETDFQDDEVALLHEPTAPYRAVSEPLVHLRGAVKHLVARKIMSPRRGDEVIDELKRRWYGERTVRRAVHLIRQVSSDHDGVAREWRDFDRFRAKSNDLLTFLQQRPFDELSNSKRPKSGTTRQ